jgi:hypothetical protein
MIKDSKGIEKLVLISVIPNDTYVDENQDTWYPGTGAHQHDQCVVCDKAVDHPGFSQDYLFSTGAMQIVHKECVEVVVPAHLMGYIEERNMLRPTEKLVCQPCKWEGKEVEAEILLPTYPYRSPYVLVYMPICSDCVAKRDEYNVDFADIGIIQPAHTPF